MQPFPAAPVAQKHKDGKESEEITRGAQSEAIAEVQHPTEGEEDGITGPKPERADDQERCAKGKRDQVRPMLHDPLDSGAVVGDHIQIGLESRKRGTEGAKPMFPLVFEELQRVAKVAVINIEIGHKS